MRYTVIIVSIRREGCFASFVVFTKYRFSLDKIQKQPPEVFHKKVFLEILQNSQEKPVPESLF